MFFSPTTKLVFPFDSTLVKEELNLDLIEFNIFFSFNDITLKVMLLSNANSYISSDISDEVNKWNKDLYLSFGYNTWNFYFSYGLNQIMKNLRDQYSNKSFEVKPLKIGLIFYIL